jgi:hypothetical protein
MFDQFLDNVRKVTETNVQLQQELLKRWAALWPGLPGGPGGPSAPHAWAERVRGLQQKWAEAVNEVVQRQRQTQQEQFAAGLKHLEEAFRLGEVKDVEALRAKTLELWQKAFQLVQQANEAQVRDLQAAVGKWTELVTKVA